MSHNQGNTPPMRRTVQLCKRRGDTSVYIDARLTDNNGLIVEGQDVGTAPEKYWGDSDYEYSVFVANEHRDKLLAALLNAALATTKPEEFSELPREDGRDLKQQQSWWQAFLALARDGSDSAHKRFIAKLKDDQKNDITLFLIETLFADDARAVSRFRDFCKSNNVPSEFFSWI